MKPYIQVLTTTEKKEDAERIAIALVEKKLAACVQIAGPITSVYRWRGNIERAVEWQCRIKSKEVLYREIQETIKSIHPYEVPEIIATPIARGSGEYLEWLENQVR
ncbi:MAG TPA: divalent-cation tolerance protein CutA [Syntrophales bacterium]|nr:divalent-cation tolerance protein CutA [Syntrophales bacterium]